MLGSPVAEERKRRWRDETVRGVTELGGRGRGWGGVSSRREYRRSEGESRDVAGRGRENKSDKASACGPEERRLFLRPPF